MLIKSVRGKTPVIGEDCFIAENATIVGEVTMGDQCSVWFNAVLRGDVHFIKMGNKVNVQDGAVVHCTYEKSPTTIGNNVSIGHNALVHGCTIKDNVLVGMGSIIMDDCVVESNSIIAAVGSIFLTKPCKTLPGPTSVNKVAPSFTILRTLCVHFTGDVNWEIKFFLISSALLTATVVTFWYIGQFGVENFVASIAAANSSSAGFINGE